MKIGRELGCLKSRGNYFVIFILPFLLITRLVLAECPPVEVSHGYGLVLPSRNVVIGDGFGALIGPAGDIDLDGFPDYFISAERDIRIGSNNRNIQFFSGRTRQKITTLGLTSNLSYLYNIKALGDIDGNGTSELVFKTLKLSLSDMQYEITAFSAIPYKHHYKITAPLGRYNNFAQHILVVPDLNHDGVNEIVVSADGAEKITDERFAPREGAVLIYSGKNGEFLHEFRSDFAEAENFGKRLTYLGDIDGDGSNDIAVGAVLKPEGQPAVEINEYFSLNKVMAGEKEPIFYMEEGYATVRYADINHDGRNEFLRFVDYNEIHYMQVFSYDPRKPLELTEGFKIQLPSDDSIGDFDVGDFNADGVPDLAIGDSKDKNTAQKYRDGIIKIYSGIDGSVLQSIRSPWDSPGLSGWGNNLVVLGDIDRNGSLELLVGDSSSMVNNDFTGYQVGKTEADNVAEAGSVALYSFSGDKNSNGIMDICEPPPPAPAPPPPVTNPTTGNTNSGQNGSNNSNASTQDQILAFLKTANSTLSSALKTLPSKSVLAQAKKKNKKTYNKLLSQSLVIKKARSDLVTLLRNASSKIVTLTTEQVTAAGLPSKGNIDKALTLAVKANKTKDDEAMVAKLLKQLKGLKVLR